MILIIGIIVVLLLGAVLTYNNLVGARNAVENAFGTIDVMLKKRYDLIPNLIEVAKTYMKHENEIFTNLASLRARATTATNTDEKVAIENQISGAMKNLLISVENYPDLKASEQFTMLQRSWNETEEQISAARRAYNAAVTAYNNAVDKFPSNIFAGMFNFKRKEVFMIAETERQNVSAKALFNS
ncbi:MAG TPA: LemA family protein [Cyclobacteriaceae bacterium]|jgi:LemA protein|nr:LemA family protein [Cytophagales bacterium]HMR56766.1 LemA family protein [Cyclobacteriaceae bacterium]HRE66622.1 LemA family protein [Cyclobacteriaceae bacterium]HRF35186.1 LemA family protein [Cyclobacteriaceae bacterium]